MTIIDSKVQKVAIEWFVRLRSGDCTDEERDIFTAWLEGSEQNQSAYELVCRRWDSATDVDSSTLDQSTPQDKTLGKTAHRWRWRLAIAATLAAFAVSLILTQSQAPIVYETAMGEQRRIQLEDGSTIHLNTTTELEISITSDRRTINLEQGEVLCDVAHDPSRPFVVRVGDAEVSAIGTVFSVYRSTEQMRVAVLEGKVAVDDSQGSENLPKGRQPVLNRGEQLVLKRGAVVDTAEVVISEIRISPSWNKGLLSFQDVPLQAVVAEINRYFPDKIQLGSDIQDFEVTGTFNLRDRELITQTLAQTYGLFVEKDDNNLILTNGTNEDR